MAIPSEAFLPKYLYFSLQILLDPENAEASSVVNETVVTTNMPSEIESSCTNDTITASTGERLKNAKQHWHLNSWQRTNICATMVLICLQTKIDTWQSIKVNNI